MSPICLPGRMTVVNCFLTALALLVSTSVASAQQSSRDRIEPTDREIAGIVKTLELPAQRDAALQKLWELGLRAVPSLVAGLRDPRSEVSFASAQILYRIGPEAVEGRDTLLAMTKGSDERVATLARWVLGKFQSRGQVLVASSGLSQLIALDLATGEIQGDPINAGTTAYDGELLFGGGRIILNYNPSNLREFGANGKVVWSRRDIRSPMDIDTLPNGNLLIADLGGRVVEVSRAGKVVWEFKCKSPYNAERLPNGNTLIPDLGYGVFEISPAGKQVWKADRKSAIDAERLANGNTLIANWQGPICIVDPSGKTVRQFTVEGNATRAHMLASGDILVGTSIGVVCVAPDGKQRWSQKLPEVGSLEVY